MSVRRIHAAKTIDDVVKFGPIEWPEMNRGFALLQSSSLATVGGGE